MPPGGDGFYYFSTYLTGIFDEFGLFDIQVNGERLCSVYTDQQGTIDQDPGQAACSGAAYVTEGMHEFMC